MAKSAAIRPRGRSSQGHVTVEPAQQPTLRYYEEVGLIDPVARDASGGHRRYREEDVDTLQALACLRAMGVGIEDMRTSQANRPAGRPAARHQRDLLTPACPPDRA